MSLDSVLLSNLYSPALKFFFFLLRFRSAWYVEHWLVKLGWGAPPPLTFEQLEMASSRVATNGGRALGVTIGCLLGMFPLLFIKKKTEEKETGEGKDKGDATTKKE